MMRVTSLSYQIWVKSKTWNNLKGILEIQDLMTKAQDWLDFIKFVEAIETLA